jgi:hypothetical protein
VDSDVAHLIILVSGWIVVYIALGGYFFVRRKAGDMLTSWVILAEGCVLFAILYTLVIIGLTRNSPLSNILSIASYVLVMVSIILLFLRLVRTLNSPNIHTFNCIDSQKTTVLTGDLLKNQQNLQLLRLNGRV